MSSSLIETIESAKYTRQEAVRAIQGLHLGQGSFSINLNIQKKGMQNKDSSKTTNMGRPGATLHALHTNKNTCDSAPSRTFSNLAIISSLLSNTKKTLCRIQQNIRKKLRTLNTVWMSFVTNE